MTSPSPVDFASFRDSINTGDMPPAPPVLAPLPLARQIRESYWLSGEDYLAAHPELNEVLIFSHHLHEDSFWDYKAVRKGDEIERQTWLNGKLFTAYVADENGLPKCMQKPEAQQPEAPQQP